MVPIKLKKKKRLSPMGKVN